MTTPETEDNKISLIEHITALWLMAMVLGAAGLARQVSGLRTLIPLSVIVIMCAVIALIVARRHASDRRLTHPTLIGLAGLGIAQIISLAFAADVIRAATHTILYCCMVLIGWAAMQLSPQVARRALIAALGALAVIGVYHVIWWWIDMRPPLGDGLLRPSSLFPNTNNLAAAMIPAMLLAARDRKWGALAVFGVGLLLTASRGSMLALAAAGVVYAAWRIWRGARLPKSVWIALGIGVMLVLPLIVLQFLNGSHGASALRLDLWQVALKAFRDHPIVGIGPESYEYAFHQYAQLEHERFHHHAHNVVLQVGAETGLIGLTALGVLIAGSLYALRGASKEGNPKSAALLAAWMAALCVQGTLDYVYWVSGNLLIAMIAGWLMLHPAPRYTYTLRRHAVIWAAYAVVAIGTFFLYFLWIGQLDGLWPFRFTTLMAIVLAAVFYGIGWLARSGSARQPTR